MILNFIAASWTVYTLNTFYGNFLFIFLNTAATCMNRCVIRQPRTPVFLGPVAIAQSSTMISLQSRVQWLQEIAILLACREGWRLSSLRSLDGLILPTLSNPILPAILKGHAMLCCLHCPLQAVSSDACPPSFHRKKSFNPEITTGLCYVATLQVVLIELCAG